MDLGPIKITEILKIDHVELYQTNNGSAVLLHKGTLYLLYAPDYKWFILKINDFNYGLSKNIPVLLSKKEQGIARAYVFTSAEGYYVIEIPSIACKEDIDAFEDILRENTQFAHKEGPEGHGLPIQVGDRTVKVNTELPDASKPSRTKSLSAAHSVYHGGKAAKEMMVNSAQSISQGIYSLGSYVQNNYLGNPEEVQIDPKTMKRVAFVNSATGLVGRVGGASLRGLTWLGNWVAKKIEPKFETHTDTEAAQQDQLDKTAPGIGYAAIHSAISVWGGMVEALDIIREGITDTSSNLVTHRYGQAAGTVFKNGVGIVTNVGLPGSKFFKKNN